MVLTLLDRYLNHPLHFRYHQRLDQYGRAIITLQHTDNNLTTLTQRIQKRERKFTVVQMFSCYAFEYLILLHYFLPSTIGARNFDIIHQMHP
jgi:hypothetical protein